MIPLAPIFILGAVCSHASHLSAMLGQHPETYAAPELNLFLTEELSELSLLLEGPRQFQVHGLLRAVAQLYAGEQTLESIAMAKRWIACRYHCSTGEVYRWLCDQVSPLRIVEPNSAYTASAAVLERAHRAFPSARFVHLVSHPRSQGEAVMDIADGALAIHEGAIDHTVHPPIPDPQYAWLRSNANVVSFFERLGDDQKLVLRWEDVRARPHQALKRLCAWLELPWSRAVDRRMLSPEQSSYAGFGPYGAHLGHDPPFLRSPRFIREVLPRLSCQGSLPWRPDGKGFIPDVTALARRLGYL